LRNQLIAHIDDIDFRLLGLLSSNGRATWADLARELGLTAPAIAQRVRRLEDRGIIRQFTAIVDPEIVAPVSAFIAVRVEGGPAREAFRAAVAELISVQECYLLTGDDCYFLKARFVSLADLRTFVDVTLPGLPGVEGTRTNVVLTTVKESSALPFTATPTAAAH
jgi:Lrp/AsnC family transcriptional regulator, leucine-responsive regulatory protein